VGLSPKVIAITNQKGGTGKTTLTALLGYELVKSGYRVLLIDLDPQAHLSSLFVKIDELENVGDGVIEVVRGEQFRIRRIKLGDGEMGLIPSGLNYIIRVYRGEIPAWDPYALYARISKEPAINKNYDFILCDTPPELFAPTLWGLYAADYVIIPSNYEELSLLGIKLLLREVLPDVFERSKKQLKVLGVVLINVTRKLSSDSIKKLNEVLKRFIKEKLPGSDRVRIFVEPLLKTAIHRYDELRDLPYRPRRHEIPLDRVIRKNKDLGQEIETLTREVLERINHFQGLT